MRFFIIQLPVLFLAFALPALAAPQIQWLWAQKKAENEEKVYFRSEYTLPEGAKSVTLTVSTDDSYELFLNGEKLGMSSEWASPMTYDLKPHLKEGVNVIALEAFNLHSAGGMALRVRATLKDGAIQDWVSDASWKCSKEVAKGWKTAPMAPKGFKPVVVIGKMGDDPWGMAITN